MSTPYVMSLSQDSARLVEVIRKRRRVMLTVFLGVFGLGVLIAFLLPTKYISSMKILIRATPTDLRATSERANAVPLGLVNEEEVNSEVELLTSYNLLREAVLKNHLERQSLVSSQAEGVDQAVRKLGKALDVTAVRKANIIEVQYADESPALAASVLRTIAAGYLEAHLRAGSTPGGYSFFKTQTEYYEKKLADKQRVLAKFSDRKGAANLDQQITLLTKTISDQEAALQQAQAQVGQVKSELAASRSVAVLLSPRINTTRKAIPNPSLIDHLTTLLADLQARRVQQSSKFQDDDPVLKETDTEIEVVAQELRKATSLVSYEESTDVNPISQNVHGGISSRTIELAGLKSKIVVLKKQIAANRRTISRLTNFAGQYRLLRSDVQNAQEDYSDYAERAENARVSEGLDQSKISNVVLAQEPTESVLPVSSHRLLVLAFTLFVAVFGSIASCLLAESFQLELQNA